MTNMHATYLYRKEIASAISTYRAAQRTIWAAWGKPIPLSQDCAAAMCEAWGTCRVAMAMADMRLAVRRGECADDVVGAGMTVEDY